MWASAGECLRLLPPARPAGRFAVRLPSVRPAPPLCGVPELPFPSGRLAEVAAPRPLTGAGVSPGTRVQSWGRGLEPAGVHEPAEWGRFGRCPLGHLECGLSSRASSEIDISHHCQRDSSTKLAIY